jgi:tetratricopeptide (TPR) repeat protein
MLNVVGQGTAGEAQLQRVSRWLEDPVRKESGNVALAAHLATLRSVQGRYGEAVSLYRQVLERDRENGMALNNLAWLLAWHERQPAAALELVQRAVQRYGPLPELLDTRGNIYTLLGQAGQAVRDLDDAVADVPSAVRYFHLAQAQLAAGNRKAAEAAWGRARSLGLKPADLLPLERPAHDKLRSELERG